MSVHGWDPRAEGARCDVCPLGPNGFLRDQTKPWAPVRGEFHPNATTLALAEMPADEETKNGRPLCGKSGAQVWDPALTAIGRKRADVDIDNLWSCQPEGPASGAFKRTLLRVKDENERLLKEGKPIWPTPTECCRPRVERVVTRYKHLIALGGEAAAAITGSVGPITSLRGDVRELPTSDPSVHRTVLLTLHPAFVLRQPHWREFLEGDVAKAFRWFEGRRDWKEPVYYWKPSPEWLAWWLGKPARWTLHDYETTMHGALRSKVYCLSLGRLVEPVEERACEKCSGTGRRKLKFDREVGWTWAPDDSLPCECCGGAGRRVVDVEMVLLPFMSCEDGQTRFYAAAEESEIKAILKRHMEDPTVWKAGHNVLNFDQMVDENFLGASPWPVMDTLPLARARNPAAKKGLKVVGSMLTDVHAWGADAEGQRIAEAPRNDRQLHFYGATDSAVNVKIVDRLVADATAVGYFRPLREELKPPKWPAHYPWTLWGVDQYRQSMCRHFQRSGFLIDQEARTRHERKLDADAVKYRYRAMKYAHDVGVTGKVHTAKRDGSTRRIDLFNPGSDDQLRRILFDEWGVIPTKQTETGLDSVDDEVLRGIIITDGLAPERRAFLDAVRRYKRARKAKATFVTPLLRRDLWHPKLKKNGQPDEKEPLCWAEDGRIHASWSEMMTSVARLSVKSNNQQNVPIPYRDQYVAPPGHVLVGWDVDQFHLRLIANRWRVGRLLQAFHEGIDPHSSLAEDWFGRAFRDAPGWGPEGFSLKRKPEKGSMADRYRHLAKIIRYRGAYADVEEGLLQTVREVEDEATGDLPFADMTLREVTRLYRIWMRAEPEWQGAWQWVMDQYAANGGWIEEAVFGRRSGDLEGGKLQAVVNYDILAMEPAVFTLIEAAVRSEFPDDFEGPGTGMIHQGHDAGNVCMRGSAWEERGNGKKVKVVCDPETERRRRMIEELANLDLSKAMPGWDVRITSEAKVGPTRRVDGSACLSNWKEA